MSEGREEAGVVAGGCGGKGFAEGAPVGAVGGGGGGRGSRWGGVPHCFWAGLMWSGL